MKQDFDLAIVGSGFAGSLLAMIARRLGHSVILLERGRHPRFVIGESSTPLANLLLEELADRYDLPGVRNLTEWGRWQKHHPGIACGLKRGFTFYQHAWDEAFQDGPAHARQLLVAASPHDAVADTHWYRPEFDQFLAEQAAALGAEYVDEADLREVHAGAQQVTLRGSRRGVPLEVRAGFVFDASGPRGFLHRALALPEVSLDALLPTQGLYSHFSGVRRWEECQRASPPDSAAPPYPPDDAAMHHVFDSGWIWVLHFNNGRTSAGVAATDACARALRFTEGAVAWERLLARLPAVREQFAAATATEPFFHSPRLPFLSASVAGRQWALLPSAAGVIDPLLSTGFPLALLGIDRLARILERDGRGDFSEALPAYAVATTGELTLVARYVASLYRAMTDFELFTALALLYFAAASFTETARRLGRTRQTGESFLLADHPEFGPRLRSCIDAALDRPTGSARAQLLDRIREAVALVDVAGLGDVTRRNWFPVQVTDLLAAAPRLGASREEIQHMLVRCGLAGALER